MSVEPLLTYYLMLDGRRMGPYDVKTIVGMRIKKTLASDQVLMDHQGGRLTVGELVARHRARKFEPQQSGSMSLVLAAFTGRLVVHKVEPRTKLPMLKCSGADVSTTVNVVPVVAAAAPAASAAAAPACPEGWKLDKKSVSKKTGAFTCTAKAGTAAPAGKLACAGTLGYFENTKKGQLGCRP